MPAPAEPGGRTATGPGRLALLRSSAEALAAVAHNRDLRRLQVARVLAVGADWGFLVTALVVVEASAGLVAVGLLAVARTVPATLLSLFARPEAAGRPERALVTVNVVCAVAAAGAAVAFALDGPLVAVGVAVAVIGGAGALVRPIQSSLFPALARRPDELVASNVAASLSEGLGTFGGPLLAGLALTIVGGVGPGIIFGAAGVAFAGAAVASGVTVADAARHAPREARAGPPLLAGAAALARRRGPALVIVLFLMQALVRSLLTILIVVVAQDLLDLGGGGVGLLNAAIGAGGILGGIAALTLASRTSLATVFVLALVAWGLPIAVIGVAPSAWLAVGGLLVVGIANAILDVSGFTLLQRTLPNADRGPVFGLFEGAIGAVSALGGLVGPLLVAALEPRGALAVTGAILPVVAALGWWRLRRVDAESVVPESRARLLRADPLFRSLPLAGVERLAVDSTTVDFAAGAVLMREGDPGDRYLLLAAGSASVSQGGRPVRALGPGDGVGEIALLRAVPRTATVVALEPVEAVAISREAFLATVTGHAESRSTATVVVGDRLAADAVRDGAAGETERRAP